MRLLLLLFVLISLHALAQPTLTPAQLEKLDKIALQDVPPRAPGIATAVIIDGKVVFERYAGYANLEDSTLIDPRSRFNIASNGKQFTALAILMLADAKKLSLADDIRKFFPDLYPGIQEKITIHHLLNHTSGIRDVYDLLSLQGITWWEKDDNNADMLGLLRKQRELNFAPGTRHLYSNSNYILLALIVEQVSQERFTTFTDRMFQQLGMPNTAFVADAGSIAGPIAKSYFNFDTWVTYNWIWNVCGDGNIFSTLKDQVQWELILQGKAKTKIKQRILLQSQSLVPNSVPNYGYGLEFGTYKDLTYRFHEGATGAWKATVLRFPAQKTSMITLTNTGKSVPSTQTRQMADVAFDLKADKEYLVTQPKGPGPYISEAELLGTYLTPEDFAFQFVEIDSVLHLRRIGRNDVALERESDNIFHQTYDPDFKQEFLRNPAGGLEVTAYYTNHAPYTLTKVANDWDNFDFKSLDGAYLNPETDVTISVRHKEGSSFDINVGDGYQTTGLLLSKTKMLVDNYTMDFPAGESRLYLNGGRIQQVAFQKR